ncbi:MAG: hypothetical protein ACYDGR_12605 [Candidatus Dormibacteria bacterium]
MSNAPDLSLYPDVARSGVDLASPQGRADYLHRVCGAWDFGIPPSDATVDLLSEWPEVLDRYPVIDSPAYHALRLLLGLPALTGGELLEADWERHDRDQGRRGDPALSSV